MGVNDKVAATGVPVGECDRCGQRRPLFPHRQTETWQLLHDCPDCGGHQEKTRLDRRLCSYCHQHEPKAITGDPSRVEGTGRLTPLPGT